MRLLFLTFLASSALALPSRLVGRANDADLSKCPGYAASNLVTTDTSLTADLKLSGDKCNAYADDLEDLKLEVEYQTGKRLKYRIIYIIDWK